MFRSFLLEVLKVTSVFFVILTLVAYVIFLSRRRFIYFHIESWLVNLDVRRATTIILAFVVIARLITISVVSYSDESPYLLMSRLVYEGYAPYRDFFLVHPPAYFIVTSLMFRFFGVGVIQAKFLPFLFSVATVFLVYEMAKEFYGEVEAALALLVVGVTPSILFMTMNALLFSECIFFSTLSAYLFLKSNEFDNPRIVFFSGFFAGLATVYRFFGAYILLTILLYLVLFRKSKRDSLMKSLTLVLGFSLVILPVFMYYSPEIIDNTISYNIYQRPTSGFTDRLKGFVRHSQYFNALPIITGFIGLCVLLSRGRMRRIDWFMVLWVMVVLAGTLCVKQVILQLYAIYFVMAVPPLAMLGGYSIHYRMSSNVVVIVMMASTSIVTCTLLTLTSLDFHVITNMLISRIDDVGGRELVVSGSSPFAHAIAFQSDRDLLMNMADHSILNYSMGVRHEFMARLNSTPTVFVLADGELYDVYKQVPEMMGERCVFSVDHEDFKMYFCNVI
ncbi:MAG: glycosyltransferase family 39 protein [Candidatus Altiarchaeota archaeon]